MLLLIFLVPLVLGLLFYFGSDLEQLVDSAFEDRDSKIRAVYEAWHQLDFVEVAESSEFSSALKAVQRDGDDLLSEEQRNALLRSLESFMKGLGGLGFVEYSKFRYPSTMQINRDLIIKRISAPPQPNYYPRLGQQASRPALTNPVTRPTPGELAIMSDVDLVAAVSDLSSQGAMSNRFVRSFSPEFSQIVVRDVTHAESRLYAFISDTVPSVGLVGSSIVDLTNSRTNALPKSVGEGHSFVEYMEEKAETLVVDAMLMLDYEAPDHAGPVGISFFWDRDKRCWVPYAMVQVGLHHETGMRIPF